jgi:hypothetical protein
VAKKPRAFAERFQLAGGLCHEQAWIALSRAVQARSVEDGEARFVDMTSVWLAHWSGEALRGRILYDDGPAVEGDSRGCLEEITRNHGGSSRCYQLAHAECDPLGAGQVRGPLLLS